PKKFVFKCNHGCAYNIVVTNKEKVDKSAIIKQLNTWMKEDFGAFNIELHYSKIKPRKIICEEFLGENITDYKFFCFNGEPKYIYVSNDLIHDRQAQIGFFYLDGSKMPLTRDDYTDIPEVKLPRFYNEMLEMSKALSKDFPFVRVDFFIANNRYYFAELTFTPGAGMMPFNPEKYDLEWGKMIDLSSIINKVEGN
ncbi:ATP-grasp fold amidoligase family protein, partial [Clostridium perfringens]